MIKQMAKEYIIILMELCTRVNGVMIFNMGRAKKVGQMALCIKASIWQVKNMVMEFTAGMMDQDMMVSGMRTK